MNEYSRLARLKDITARNTAELLASAYGIPEEKARWFADKIDSAPSFKDAVRELPKQLASGSQIAELIEELRIRKGPADQVRDGLQSIRTMNEVIPHLLEIREKKKEYLLAFFLNARQQLLAKEII